MKRRTIERPHTNTYYESDMCIKTRIVSGSPVNRVPLKTVFFQAVPNRNMERDPNQANDQEKEKRKPPFPSNPASIALPKGPKPTNETWKA